MLLQASWEMEDWGETVESLPGLLRCWVRGTGTNLVANCHKQCVPIRASRKYNTVALERNVASTEWLLPMFE